MNGIRALTYSDLTKILRMDKLMLTSLLSCSEFAEYRIARAEKGKVVKMFLVDNEFLSLLEKRLDIKKHKKEITRIRNLKGENVDIRIF